MERTKRSEKRQRSEGVFIRLTEKEKKEAQEKAKEVGLALGAFGREQMLGKKTARSVKKPAPWLTQIDKLSYELNMIGNNLNQLARAANMGKEIDAELLKAIREETGKIYLEFNKALERL